MEGRAIIGPRPSLAEPRGASDSRGWNPQEYHWIVEIGGQVIGEVELVHDQQQRARLRRLRIDPAWQHTAALARLLDCVGRFCREHGQVRVEADHGCAPRWVLGLLKRRGLHVNHRRTIPANELWEPVPVR